MEKHVRVGVGILMKHNGQLLLMRRKGAHGEGTWSVGGGHLEFGESIEDCAKREILEETGLIVGSVQFAGITNDFFEAEQKHYITVWVTAAYESGDPRIAEREAHELKWFPLDALPSPLFLPLEQMKNKQGYFPNGNPLYS